MRIYKASIPRILVLFFISVSIHGVMAQDGEQKLEIGTLHGQIRYDKDILGVRAGGKVQLTFKNTDEMQHNLVILKPGNEGIAEVAQAALLLGTEAIKKDFVPDHPQVLFSTRIVNPHQSETIKFTAPTEPGDYPYVCTIPGHSMIMKGIMRVGQEAVPDQVAKSNPGTPNLKWRLEVRDEPLVERVFLKESPARSIAVGLPGGTNFCFDAESCAVLYGWTGLFLDVSKDRGARGGGICSILGKRFDVGTDGFPLRFGRADAPAPAVRFTGYRRNGIPHFLYSVDGIEIEQTISATVGAVGLSYEFKIAKPPGDVFFRVNPAGLTLAASAGSWSEGTLKVPAANAGKFTVTITRK